MSLRRARWMMAVSAAALVVVAAVWVSSVSGDDRADLVGDEVQAVPPSTTTTTVPTSADRAPAVTVPPPTTPDPVPEVPIGIGIPSLGVLAPTVPVGLEDDGAMEVPGASESGWYRYGVLPGGAAGSAVIAAHVDLDDQPGVFLELSRLELGAEVVVADAAGARHRFVVTERFQVDKDELPVDELFRRDGPHVLTLVTCGGAFDRSDRSYDDNIVIRATPA